MTPEERAARLCLVHRIRGNTMEPEWLVLDYDENGWGYAVAGDGDHTRSASPPRSDGGTVAHMTPEQRAACCWARTSMQDASFVQLCDADISPQFGECWTERSAHRREAARQRSGR